MGLFAAFKGPGPHTTLDTAATPVATGVRPATPNVYGQLPSLSDWLKRVLGREIDRRQLDALVACGVRRPFHLATLSSARFAACGFERDEVSKINGMAVAAVGRNKPGGVLALPRSTYDSVRLAEVVAECSATHVIRLSLVWHVGEGRRTRRVERSFPDAALCGDVQRRVAVLTPWEHVKYVECVFERDSTHTFDSLRRVPQHRLVGLKVKTSGKKHRLRVRGARAASERRLGRKPLGCVTIRLEPPQKKGWGLCGLDVRPEASGIGGLGARWARVREARFPWATYVADDAGAAERRRLSAAVDCARQRAEQRDNVNHVTGRIAVDQQDAMLRALDVPRLPARAVALPPTAPPLPMAAFVRRVGSETNLMAPVPAVTPLHRPVRIASLPFAEVISAPPSHAVAQAEVVWPGVPTTEPRVYHAMAEVEAPGLGRALHRTD